MDCNRRSIVRVLSLTPLMISNLKMTRIDASPPPTQHVNILLHGLFFMKFEAGKLIAKSPVVNEHTFCMVSGGALLDLTAIPQIDIDLTQEIGGLDNAGTDDSFARHPQIPQFPRLAVGDWNDSYKLKITLPIPEQIVPLRAGKVAEFKKVALGQIANLIVDACSHSGTNSDFALITCLRYSKKRDFGAPRNSTVSFYAEHRQPPAVKDVNSALDRANRSLFVKPGFDLSFQDEFPPLPATHVCRDAKPGYGIKTEDENSLPEIEGGASCPAGARGTDVANCVQFGING